MSAGAGRQLVVGSWYGGVFLCWCVCGWKNPTRLCESSTRPLPSHHGCHSISYTYYPAALGSRRGTTCFAFHSGAYPMAWTIPVPSLAAHAPCMVKPSSPSTTSFSGGINLVSTSSMRSDHWQLARHTPLLSKRPCVYLRTSSLPCTKRPSSSMYPTICIILARCCCPPYAQGRHTIHLSAPLLLRWH